MKVNTSAIIGVPAGVRRPGGDGVPTIETENIIGKQARRVALQIDGNNLEFVNIIPRRMIEDRLYSLAMRVLNPLFRNEQVLVMPIMNGALGFCWDTLQYVSEGASLEVASIQARSYGNNRAPSDVVVSEETIDPRMVRGKTVLLMDDILDTGQTVAAVTRMIKECEPKRIITAFMLRKRGKQTFDVQADYVLFDIHPESWAFGFGMDLDGRFRQLRFIADANTELYDQQLKPIY